VVIDPGHGGKDSGTRSVLGRELEKTYTLDWALRLAHQLQLRGWTPVLTRTNDADVSLADRVALADRVGADFFISLHFNSGAANRELTGIETYCLTPTGMPSNLTREYEDDPRESHPNNQYDEQNVLLATRLHRSLLRATNAVDRGVRHARFMAVLRGQNRPAVLIEGGYLSNVAEARRVATPDYRQALAEAVAKGLE
jgi:N-acetylmuramoyl-L-alanine amidase